MQERLTSEPLSNQSRFTELSTNDGQWVSSPTEQQEVSCLAREHLSSQDEMSKISHIALMYL